MLDEDFSFSLRFALENGVSNFATTLGVPRTGVSGSLSVKAFLGLPERDEQHPLAKLRSAPINFIYSE